MSSSSSSGRLTTFEALPPPKRQQTFPARRRSVKAKPTLPRLRKDQSTLTQLDFVSTPTSRSDIIDISSDEDFEHPRPKKKRRKSKFDEKEAGQSTLTQFDRDIFARKAQQVGLDEDEFRIWEDYEPERILDDVAERQHRRKRTLSWLRPENDEVGIRYPTPEIPETSQNKPPQSPTNAKDLCQVNSGNQHNFETPRNVRFQEVPSSQTPPSTKDSIRTIKRNAGNDRSPLKERSNNSNSTAALSPESQNISMKMLEKVRFESRKIPLNDVVGQHTSEETTITVGEQASTIADSPDLTRRTFSRTDLIRDSQSEDAALSRVSSADSAVKPVRTLKRITTVQDSQFDDEDNMSETHLGDSNDYDESQLAEDSQYPVYGTQQASLDPVNSALDRDALRFGWTQTQRPLSDVGEEDADDETDDEDLDRGCTTIIASKTALLSSDRPSEKVEEVSDGSIVDMRTTGPFTIPRRPDSRDDSAYESGDHTHRGETQVLPSSPPRPSQVSTVVPTQASLPEPPLRTRAGVHSSQQLALVEPITFSISPHKPIHHLDILSSSPFPLPPWSSPKKAQCGGGSREQEITPAKSSQLAKLVDYSLPPPPALGPSSAKGTPMSSAT